ncbi:MAG: hypothetical protein LBU32_04930 [Clostridiales bacterium]|jgi:hypothetical protein|nr:hypothetical protein [Clostridiales bacterium]
MISILELITEEIRNHQSTISKFIDNNGFSRAGFYRMMNEPSRITEEDFQRISNALQLDEKKEKEYRKAIKYSSSRYSEEVHAAILGKLCLTPSFATNRKKEVEFFSSESRHHKTIKTYSEIIDEFLVNRADAEEKNEIRIHVKVLNCLSESALSSLFHFTTLLSQAVKSSGGLAEVKMEHILTICNFGEISKIETILNLGHMVQFKDYTLSFEGVGSASNVNPPSGLCAELLENMISIKREVVKREDKRLKVEYFTIHTSNMRYQRDHCFYSTERCYYDFCQNILSGLKSNTTHTEFEILGAVELNELISSFKPPYRKLMIKYDFCLDNLLPSIIDRHMDEIMQSHSDLVRSFRKSIDQSNKYSFYDDDSFFTAQKKFLRERFNANEHPGAINVFDVRGIIDFVRTGTTLDIQGKLTRFTNVDVEEQLAYVLKQVELYYGNPAKQQFYFFKETNSLSNLVLVDIDTQGIVIMNKNCIDLINTNFFFNDASVAKTLYEIAAASFPNNMILTKEEAVSFLNVLIASLK